MQTLARALVIAAIAAAGCSTPPTPSPDVATDDAQDDAAPPDDTTPPTPDAGPIVGPSGGTVDLFNFGVFGDVRPSDPDRTDEYPTMVIGQVIAGIARTGAQFVVATGDYMFAGSAAVANAQVPLLVSAESAFPGFVFHAMGNHECTGATASNCPNASETGNVQVYRALLLPGIPSVYFDWTVHTSMGDAHFVMTAPNAWSSSQAAWLTRVLAQTAAYTFVIAHEPPTSGDDAPGSTAIEAAIAARTGGATLRLYGHTHEYRHLSANALIAGNAGAPLQSMSNDHFGYVNVTQRADGNVVVTSYAIGSPPTVVDSFVVTPAGTTTH